MNASISVKCENCGRKLVEMEGKHIWWLGDDGKRTGDAYTICAGQLVGIVRCCSCGWSTVWAARQVSPNEVYTARRTANGMNATLKDLRQTAPP